MIVLSLFDGMSCGRLALERAGVQVTKYYASEIDKYAIQVSKNNYPDVIQLGDINNWTNWGIETPDLVIGGSPCQGFSFAGKQLAFDDPRSALFWKYVEIVRHYKPKYFLLENVRMKKEHLQVITDALGVEPICINSALVSAQNRVRYYWTNIPNVTQPADKGIVLKDIIEHEVCDRDKSFCIDANYWKGGSLKQYFEKHRRQLIFSQCGGNKHVKVLCTSERGRRLNTEGTARDDKNGSVVRGYEVRADGKTCALTTVLKDNYVTEDYIIRKLTPVECERLQTVLQYIKTVELVLCCDLAKSFVDAVEKNPKLRKLVLSAENKELKEYAILANQNMNASRVSIKNTALQDVDMQTQVQTKKCTIINQGVSSSAASTAESITTCKQVESEVGSATQSAFITITEGKITHYGKEALPPKEQSYTEQMNGKIALKLSGKETMQDASDALSALETIQTNQNFTSITSFRLSTKNLEQMLIISYWFAKNAIGGFTQDTTQEKTLYLNLIDGYTAHVSNTQRYRMLGNGWTVDVIAHIFKGLNNVYF